MLYSLSEFDVLSCPQCDFVFLSVSPDRNTLQEMYGTSYFQERAEYFVSKQLAGPIEAANDATLSDFRQVLSVIEKFCPSGKLLDVGCGAGVFLGLARSRGFDAYGVEISPFAARLAQQHLGPKVVQGTLEETSFPAGYFDVVTMLDVFEHFTKPLAELRLAAQLLRPDGLLVINTPNERALLRKLARVAYVASLGRIVYPVTKLYHEYHLSYFSRLSLLRSLNECGFEIRLMGSKPMLGVKGRASPLLRKALRGFSWVEGLLDMQYELLAVARKA